MEDVLRRAQAAEKTVEVLKRKVLELYNGDASAIQRQLTITRRREEENRRKSVVAEVRATELARYSETLEAEVARRTEAMRQQTVALEQQAAELRVARDEALQASRAKSAFLAMMSHEIRTPLNGVLGMAALLQDGPLSAEQQALVATIRTSGDGLLLLVNDILDFSRVEAGRLSLEHLPFDVREVTEDVADLFATKAGEKNLALVVDIDPNLPSSVIGDAGRVRQILLNLVGNAVKFTESGEVVVTVSATHKDGDEPSHLRLHFAVRDTGIGILDSEVNRLFETFSQVDSSISRKYGGTGLGLAIVKLLTELMGGSAWVTRGSSDKGSIFHATVLVGLAEESKRLSDSAAVAPRLNQPVIRLEESNIATRQALQRLLESIGATVLESGSEAEPAVQILSPGCRPIPKIPLLVLLRPGESIDDSAPSSSPCMYLRKPVRRAALLQALGSLRGSEQPRQAKTTFRQVSGGLRVLLAEDDGINQRVATLMLARMGIKADVVSNGEQAVRAVSESTYDCVLMDVCMPDMDGLTAARLIRQDTQIRQPTIIAMTANVMGEDRAACLQAGMDGFVSKPIVVAELLEALERVAKITAR